MKIYNNRVVYSINNNRKIWNAVISNNIGSLNTYYSGLRKRFSYFINWGSVSCLLCKTKNLSSYYTVEIPLTIMKPNPWWFRYSERSLIKDRHISFRKLYTHYNPYVKYENTVIKQQFIPIRKFTSFPFGYMNKLIRMTKDDETCCAG